MLFIRTIKPLVISSIGHINRLRFKRFFNYSSLVSQSSYLPQNFDREVLRNHSEWFILLGYLKHLTKHPSEFKFDKCVNILINIGDTFLQHNEKSQFINANTYKFEWNNGLLRSYTGVGVNSTFAKDLSPSEVLNLIKILSKLRLYHRICNYKFEKKESHSHSTSNSLTDSKSLFSDLVDEIDPNSFKSVSPKFKSNRIGPLRFQGNSLVGCPSFLSNPLLFELTDCQFLKGLETQNSEISEISNEKGNHFFRFIGGVMAQFLDQLLIFVSNSDFTDSKLCILSMYLSVMIYGPKIQTKKNSKVDLRVEESFSKIVDYVFDRVKKSGNSLSLRSLAYLINSCKPRHDLLQFVAERIMEHDGPLGEDYLENFLFCFTRSYYKHDGLYEKLASIINRDSQTLSPVVVVNLMISFSRIGKLDLVKPALVERLSSLSDEDFKKCSSSLLGSLKTLSASDQQLSEVLSSSSKLSLLDNVV